LQRRADQDELPVDGAAAARAGGSARGERTPAAAEPELMRLQHTAGNKAVAGLVASVQTARGSSAAAVATPPRPGELPRSPSIAASASGIAMGGSFGDHATVFLAAPKGGQPGGALDYFFIDLIIDREAPRKRAIDIRIRPLKGSWPDAATSTTWNVSGTGAIAALGKAMEFAANRSKYSYSRLGIGFRRYNCALFAEKILQAAGVNRTAGLLASTPLELAMGKKLPERRKREKKATGPAPIPAQYDI
jgi:hypothetical protein